MTIFWERSCCGITLRALCMIIGYLHLISCITDTAYHVLSVAVITNGFKCDIRPESLTLATMPWLEPLLVLLNIGTHGFYPFPYFAQHQYSLYVEKMPVPIDPKCYPGMLHVNVIDVLNFLINLIWMRIVLTYIGALHKKNPEPMRVFFIFSIIKIVMQVVYLGYQPQMDVGYALETYWSLKIIDILISVLFLAIVKKYINVLKKEQELVKISRPPSYIECLINANIESLRYKGPKHYEEKKAYAEKELEIIESSTQNPI